ncbi:hypothetical protein ACFYZB_20245 [Streptomyces sp. NPDC001852]|uniref:hypothetical protein n=1 Tax=Streptomyces sp. NPDC001852 TaxID=3364619 RepID=UPI0036A46D91
MTHAHTRAAAVPRSSIIIVVDLGCKYTDGWGVKVDDVATAPTGEIYTLYSVHRHT